MLSLATAAIDASASNSTIENIDTQEYYTLDVVSIANQVKDILSSKQITLSLQGKVSDINIVADVLIDFSNGLYVNVSAVVLEKSVVAVLQDGIIYVTIDDNLKIKGNIDELPDLIEGITTALNGGASSSLGAISIPSLTLTYDGTNFVVVVAGFEISVDVEHGISSASVNSSMFTATASIDIDNQAKSTPAVQNVESFDNDINTIVPYVSAIKKLINSTHVYANVRARINGTKYSFTLKVQHQDDLRVQLTGTLLNKDLDVKYIDGDVYVSALGLNYYLTQEDLADIISVALENIDKFGVHFDGVSITSFMIREDILQIILNEDIIIIANITNGEFTSIELMYDKIFVNLYLSYDVTFDITANQNVSAGSLRLPGSRVRRSLHSSRPVLQTADRIFSKRNPRLRSADSGCPDR